jgi:hypothetical protein
MRTIRTKVFRFNELKENAKENAIEWYKNNSLDHDFIYDDMYKVIKEFNSLFNTKEGSNSWLDYSTSHFEEDIINLKGFRLQKYIFNNYGYKLFKGEYYGSLKSNNVVYHSRIKSQKLSNGNFFNPYYSAIKKQTSCVLTGTCYDDYILKPIYDFLENRNPGNIDFEELINDCFNEAKKVIENEIYYRSSDEYITEEIESNNYEFTAAGNIF